MDVFLLPALFHVRKQLFEWLYITNGSAFEVVIVLTRVLSVCKHVCVCICMGVVCGSAFHLPQPVCVCACVCVCVCVCANLDALFQLCNLPACPHTGGNTLYGVGCADIAGVSTHRGNTLYGVGCADIAGVSTHRKHTLW